MLDLQICCFDLSGTTIASSVSLGGAWSNSWHISLSPSYLWEFQQDSEELVVVVVVVDDELENDTSHVFDDVAKVTMVGSGCVSSSLSDVVVSLFAGEKGDGSLPSSAADEEATANLLGFRLSFSFPFFLFFLCVVVHPADPESCHPS
ncbi:hypothetical protein Tco_0401304 [Tanacetum coccineum]